MCFVCASHRAKSGEHEGHIEAPDNAAFQTLVPLGTVSGQAAASINTDAYINTIAEGLSWSGSIGVSATVTYSFDNSGIDSSVVYASNPTAFTAAQQQTVVNVFNEISSFANITFVQAASSASANLHFYNGTLGGNTAGIAGFYYDGNNKLTYATIGMDSSQSNFTSVGTYDYTTLLHEIGHAIGLKHSGNYSGSETGPFLPAEMDTTDTTVMSYNNGVLGNPESYRALDIAAIQYLYGAAAGAGNNDSSTASSPDAVSNDSLSALTPSDMKGGLGSDTMSGSSGNDTMYGGRAMADADDAPDQIYGNGGFDEIYGNTGGDTIYGDDANHALSGNDTIFGGLGEDIIYGGQGDDSLAGGGGIKHPQDDADVIYGGAGNDSVVANGGNDIVYGGTGNDTFWGGLGDDELYGDEGDDIIAGQHGNEGLVGGTGADIFYYLGSDGGDTIYDFNPAEDKLRLHSNLNDSGIFTAEDAVSRLTDAFGYKYLDLGGGSYVYFGESTMTITTEHFEVI